MRSEPSTSHEGRTREAADSTRHGPSGPARRWQVLGVIRDAAERLRDDHARPEDASAVDGAIRATCDEKGISPQEYRTIVQNDPELEHLEQLAIAEALAGSTDPGPNAAISRESMSGKPGNTMKSRSHPEPPSPQFDVSSEPEVETYDVRIETTEQTMFAWKFKRY